MGGLNFPNSAPGWSLTSNAAECVFEKPAYHHEGSYLPLQTNMSKGSNFALRIATVSLNPSHPEIIVA